MPINKKEHLVYTFLMVLFMAAVMTSYNVILHNGFSVESIKIAWLMFPFTFVTAFLCEWFLVGKLAMKLSHKLLKQDDLIIKKVLITALFFVTGMVVLMSFFGPLLANGFSTDILEIWGKSIPVNFAMAYPLQVIIAGPVVGYVFRKLFPVGTLMVG
ncbi:DUF2798 domain-containing protein [Pedobacter sp. PLR]|uniref:DUF2798 domain-containing protein n=1 Tax=Pedobacter sp. PLR TaxID=2994465 RepID=UPI002246DA30|nr:DUF2798 domain-containing protein [Pedobacter sp. PLR]MCX2451406.1 DUF2798 domain-containing protein [Pedobacter sp. PLR]